MKFPMAKCSFLGNQGPMNVKHLAIEVLMLNFLIHEFFLPN